MMKTTAKMIITVLIWALFLGSAQGQSNDLTGYWNSNDGAVYRFRQVGSKLFWTVDHSPVVINVFYGTIAGNMITGQWADVPGGQMNSSGTLALKIESKDRIVKVSQTGTYGGTFWNRGNAPVAQAPTSGPPPGSGPGAPTGPPPESLPGSTPQEQTPKPVREGNLSGCWSINFPQNNIITSIFQEGNGFAYEYFHNTQGYDPKSRGTIVIDPANPTLFEMRDSESWLWKKSTMCTWKGEMFIDGGGRVREVTNGEVDCQINIKDAPRLEKVGTAWTSIEQQACARGNLKGSLVPDMVPLFDSIPGPGRVWSVEGTGGWRGKWTRRKQGDIYDGDWRKDGQRVRTEVRINRVGDSVTIKRHSSSDGWGCLYEGQFQGNEVRGKQNCSRGAQKSGPFDFKATVYP